MTKESTSRNIKFLNEFSTKELSEGTIIKKTRNDYLKIPQESKETLIRPNHYPPSVPIDNVNRSSREHLPITKEIRRETSYSPDKIPDALEEQ